MRREKNPSPDAKAGKMSCLTCGGKGSAVACKDCGYTRMPMGKFRVSKPSTNKRNPTFGKSEELLVSVLLKGKSKPFHGYNKKKHARTGGLSAKGRAAAKRKTGANLKRPVTKKPSKLKRGGKAAKRRKSFCARMSGVKGPTSKGGKLTPKGAALRRWNC